MRISKPILLGSAGILVFALLIIVYSVLPSEKMCHDVIEMRLALLFRSNTSKQKLIRDSRQMNYCKSQLYNASVLSSNFCSFLIARSSSDSFEIIEAITALNLYRGDEANLEPWPTNLSSKDSFGRYYRVQIRENKSYMKTAKDPYLLRVYSSGENGIDDGGAGDDIFFPSYHEVDFGPAVKTRLSKP